MVPLRLWSGDCGGEPRRLRDKDGARASLPLTAEWESLACHVGSSAVQGQEGEEALQSIREGGQFVSPLIPWGNMGHLPRGRGRSRVHAGAGRVWLLEERHKCLTVTVPKHCRRP